MLRGIFYGSWQAMYKKIACVILTLISAITVACGGGGNSKAGRSTETGSLIVNIYNVSDIATKVVLPGGEMQPYSYVITGKGPGGSTFTRTITGETSVEIQGLVFGEWEIYVEALNNNNVSIGGGDTIVTIHTGETTLCSVTVMPFEGIGMLELAINWDIVLTNPKLDIRLSRRGNLPFDIPYQLSASSDSADVSTEIDAGYYTLTIDLYESLNGTDTRIGGAVEIVRIAQGMISSKTITIITGPSQGDDSGIRNEFPVSAGAPEGNDGLSGFSNGSGAGSSVSGLSGAAYVAPPGANNMGTVNLSYPIAVPSGRGGSGPKVSLSYSSNSGDGLAGVGWKLSAGLGIISRSNKNGPICYDKRDTFIFNDNRLVKVDGTDNSENGTYRLEIESEFSRFELTNAESGGVWRIYDKSGTVSVYGADNTSRMRHPDNPNKVYS
jgi:hypothetical protein